MLDGKSLEYEDKKIELPEPITGDVLKVEEAMVMLPGKINAKMESQIFLTLPTGVVYVLPILKTTTTLENTQIHLREKVYFEYDSKKPESCVLQSFPNTEFDGKITARIPLSAYKYFASLR